MTTLQVYISEDCWTCEETQRIVADLASKFPAVRIELVNTAETPMPEGIFAVPTYVLDGRVISLGNPSRDDLFQRLQNTKL